MSITKKIFNCYGGTEMGNWVYFHDCKKSDLKNFKSIGDNVYLSLENDAITLLED